MRIVPVKAGSQSYDIRIEEGLLADLAAADELARWQGRRAAVVTDANVAPLYGDGLCAALEAMGIRASVFPVPAGEASKCHRQLLALYDGFLDMGLTRGDLAVALGGGVVGDLAGYAAATYQRGVSLVQMPTTLLAQVDSSVGGKVAVNLPRGKNLAGAFCQPALVLIDPLALHTLDARQFGAGLGEVVKYGCIADAALFARLEEAGGRAGIAGETADIIARCCAIKADYVLRDPFDRGARMELNFGHTLGHALENLLGYGALLHGEAVCAGMCAAARFGERLGITPVGVSARVQALLSGYGLPSGLPRSGALTPAALRAAMALDKKADHAALRVVLLEDIGRATVRAVSPEALDRWIAEELAYAEVCE